MPNITSSRQFRMIAAVALIGFTGAVPTPTRADSPAARPVHGEIVQVDGVTVLRVWGDARERGFAYGWLMADQVVKLTDTFIRTYGPLGGAAGFEKAAAMCRGMMVVEPDYEAEMRGLIEGVEAKLGDKTVIPVLKRKATYLDVLTLNAFADLGRLGCSSFAAWGDATPDGQTISARNLDWFGDASEALSGHQIVIAQLPRSPAMPRANLTTNGEEPAETPRETQGWVSVTWPGLTICLTGINADGVTLAMHDSGGRGKWIKAKSTPRGFILREAIEFTHAPSIIDDITAVLRKRHTVVGNNFPANWPSTGGSLASFVFEYDGDQAKTGGVSVRGGDGGNPTAAPDPGGDRPALPYQICTNHYRTRARAASCDRYETLSKRLADAKNDKITVAAAWKMLDDVAMFSHIKTYHSVVFEPNARRMHVAFSDGKIAAPKCAHHTLDVTALLKGGTPAARETAPAANR